MDNLLKRDFHSNTPLKRITDITKSPASNGKLYVSAIFDCFDIRVLGLTIGTNMKVDFICTRDRALITYPALECTIIHNNQRT